MVKQQIRITVDGEVLSSLDKERDLVERSAYINRVLRRRFGLE